MASPGQAGTGAAAQPGSGAVAGILALTLLLAPALGVTSEDMLQDTLKSIIVSFGALMAALLFFWQARSRGAPLRWHAVVLLPLLLMAYAVGSMAWSHAYLGGVEAIRWFVFALIVWLGLQVFSRERLPWLAAGIHAGAAVASTWAVLQFLADFHGFPQGPHPASTFVNRNFFAEFAVSTLPFGALLLARARSRAMAVLLAASCGLIVLAILMTGTRAALVALWVQLLLVFPLAAWLHRRQFAFGAWPAGTRALVAAVLLVMVGGLGSVPTGDPQIVQEGRGVTALERGFKRTGSISTQDASLGLRMVMWKATLRMIADRPWTGVGAGAWENEIPLYQAPGAQLETDYYVHNEYLQLVAEYGLVGWLFLLALAAWLVQVAVRTLRGRRPEAQEDAQEAPWRAAFLASLLALFIVSNVGFAWRMAATGALFACCLGALAASEFRLRAASRRGWTLGELAWKPAFAGPAIAASVAAMGVAGYITVQAARCEYELVEAARLALTIGGSADPQSPRWNAAKARMLTLARDGIDINPHYRKITPIIGDELARWGDWRNAVWIWESVLSSRPYIVAILTNVARGELQIEDLAASQRYLERAQRIQPGAPAVLSLRVLLAVRQGRTADALALGREALAQGIADYDMGNALFTLAQQAGDTGLAEEAMLMRVRGWDVNRTEGLLQLALLCVNSRQADKATEYFRQALASMPPGERPGLLSQIPSPYRERLLQMSASKG